MEELVRILEILQKDYDAKDRGKNLKILSSWIHALTATVTSQAITKGTPALLLGLTVAFQGIEKEKSAAGILGKNLDRSIKAVSNLIADVYLNENSSKQLFQAIFKGVMIVSLASAHLMDHWIGSKETYDFGLMMTLILKTGNIQAIMTSMAEGCGADEEQQKSVSYLMSALILFVAIIAVMGENPLNLKEISQNFKGELIEGLEDIQKLLTKAEERGKTDESITNASIFLQQAIVSVREEDFETLMDAYKGLLELIHTTPEGMNQEIKEVKKFAEAMKEAWVGMATIQQTTTSQMI